LKAEGVGNRMEFDSTIPPPIFMIRRCICQVYS